MPAHVVQVPCHSITRLRHFYNYMSSVTYYLIIEAFLSTLYVHDILLFMFMFMFQFIFRFHIVFRFHAYSIWHFRYLYGMMPIHTSFKYSCPYMNLFYLEIGIIPIESFEQKLWHFHAKLVGLPILHSGLFEIPIFLQCLASIFDTGSLYSFKAKVLRVLLQIQSTETQDMT